MLPVKFIEKIQKGPKGENIERKLKDTKKFDKPESYNSFISKIANHFKIPKQNIELICLTNDEDEIGINNDEDLNENLDEVKEFHVFSESGIEEKPKKDNPPSEENSNSIKNESKEDGQKDEDDDEYKIKIDINIDIKDNEIEDIINKQIKDIKIDDDINDEIEFDINKYKDKLIKQNENYINDFKSQFHVDIQKIYNEKTQLFKSSILNIVDNQSKTQIDILKKLNNDTSNLNNGISEIVNETNKINKYMEELKDNWEKNPNINLEKNISKSKNKNNVDDKYGANNFIFDENDNDDDNKSKVKFLKEFIENEELDTKCKCIIINDIKIQNIGNKTPDKLFFIRDKKSSNDFILYQFTNINSLQLTSTGDKFDPGRIENHSIALAINNPIVGKTYYLYLYVREKEDGENISEPLKIVYKIKEDEEAAIRRKEEQERKERKEKEDKDKIRKEEEEEKKRKEEEKEKIRKEEEEEKKRKEEEEEKKRKEKEEKEKIRKEEEEKKKRKEKEDKDKKRKEEEEEKRRKEEEEKRRKEEEEKRRREEEEKKKKKKAIELYKELDDDYNLGSIKEKDEVIQKIIELNCDKDEVVKWIEESL